MKKWAERWREGQPTPTLALFQILSLGDTMTQTQLRATYRDLTFRTADNVLHVSAYAWPGGYPTYFVTNDGGSLCPQCVRSERNRIVHATLTTYGDREWSLEGQDVNYEDDHLFCDHCARQIESAYGGV